MKVVCISASNILSQSAESSTSYKLCQIVMNEMTKLTKTQGTIIDLKNQKIQPCIGCGKCLHSHRCIADDDFNKIYLQIINANTIFIVSPHYAPIPAKLVALLEKMEQITFLHWGKDNSYKSEVYGKSTGVISHGGGGLWAVECYKSMRVTM